MGVRRWSPARIRAVAGAAAAGAAVLGAVLLLLGPVSWLLAGDTVRGLRGKEQADALNAVRQTVLAAVGGTSVLLGAAYTARTYRLSRRGQVTDRYSTAIGQLASDKREERLGAVYGLEHVLAESPQDHATVVGVLSAFVRENARRPGDPPGPGEPWPDSPLPPWGTEPPADVRAAVEVLARRPAREEARRLDLRRTELAGLMLRKADFHHPPRLAGTFLTWSDLRRADLRGADLTDAILTGADLRHALLAGTDFTDALLARADLRDAHLMGAVLRGADLTGAVLTGADLAEADLRDAALTGADLTGADLTGASLSGADFTGASLSGADLSGADLQEATGLTSVQVAQARTDAATRPPGGLGAR
ncbi:pentapeptide repeat-containing protein [Streptomyces sp. NPDC051940]|uniref:pentapeptide repeat-containing protein n=1 Tax=Streptomyces sp. NPDC051940 TaxID=3155675 RepID=UPI00341F6457